MNWLFFVIYFVLLVGRSSAAGVDFFWALNDYNDVASLVANPNTTASNTGRFSFSINGAVARWNYSSLSHLVSFSSGQVWMYHNNTAANTLNDYSHYYHGQRFRPSVVSIVDITSESLADWFDLVGNMRAIGLNIVMPVYTLSPVEIANSTLLNIFSWGHDSYWNFIRYGALYGGGLSIALPEIFNTTIPAYQRFVCSLFSWGQGHHVQISAVITVDYLDAHAPTDWLTYISQCDNLPTQIVLNCKNISTLVNGSCANVSLAANQMFRSLSNVNQCGLPLLSSEGTGLNGLYYINSSFGVFAGSRVDPTVNFTWQLNESPWPGKIPDGSLYSMIWNGIIIPRYTGTHYFFVTIDDGVNVTINGQQLLYSWAIQNGVEAKSPGFYMTESIEYTIEILYTNLDSGGTIWLSWSSFCEPMDIIPQSQFFPSFQTSLLPNTATDTGSGVRADYYLGNTWVGWQDEQTLFVDWGNGGPNLTLGFPTDNFRVSWAGQISPMTTGEHVFYLDVDDFASLYVNDLLLISTCSGNCTGALNLVSGLTYTIRIDYQEKTGTAHMKLQWACGAIVPKSQIPATQLKYQFPLPFFEVNMSTHGYASSESGIVCNAQQRENTLEPCGTCYFPGNATLNFSVGTGSLASPVQSPRTACAWGFSNVSLVGTNVMLAFGTDENVARPFFLGSINGFAGAGENGQNLTADFGWNNSQWNHVCVRYTNDATSLYLNGQSVGLLYDKWITPSGYLTIGGAFGTNFWNGFISDVVVWNATLTGKEIMSLYNSPRCASSVGCDGKQFSSNFANACGFCNGNLSCLGCDGVPNSGKKLDICGNCGGNGSGCILPNPCDKNWGGCLYMVECINLGNGTNSCGNCPTGTYAAQNSCLSLCGDGVCDANILEDCVSCPKDCLNADCGTCGDNYCDKSVEETCTTCSADCGSCDPTSCNPKCKHGKCENNVCICEENWTGPSCRIYQNQPITVGLNSSNPSSTVNSSAVQFSVSIKKIAEMSGIDEIREISISDIEFNRTYSFSGQNNVTTYTATLPNLANINVVVTQFEESPSSEYEFAGTTTNFLPHTLKFTINIAKWPFIAQANSLLVVFDAKADTEATTCHDESTNVRWLAVIVGNVTLYGQFLDKAVVDDKNRNISFSFNATDSSIAAVLPHFWDYSILDPSFSVLLGDSTDDLCSPGSAKNNHLKKILLEIVLPCVVGLLLLIALFVVLYPRLKTRWKAKKNRVPSSDPLEKEMNNMQFEKVNELSVSSATGNYRLSL